MVTLNLFAMQAEANVCTPVSPTGYSIAVGEFSGDQVEGKFIKYVPMWPMFAEA